MDLMGEQVLKRTFRRHGTVHVGRFYQSAGLLGLDKKTAQRLLSGFIRRKQVKKRNGCFLELP